MVRAVGPYRMDAAQVDSYGIYTNLPPAGAFRGAMSSQTTWAFESHMDTLAHAIGMDPLEFRLKNVLRSGDKFATGETMHDVHFDDCLRSVVNQLGWEKRPLPQHTETVRYGRGIGVMMKSTIPTSRSECDITIDQEGRVTLATSTVEMGQGTHTALAQITADAVGVPANAVTVGIPDTNYTPFDSTTSASRGTSMMGAAAIKGGADLQRQLIELAVAVLEFPASELGAGDGFVFVTSQPDNRIAYGDILKRHNLEKLSAHGEHATQHGLDPETGQGVATPHWHQGAGACEIAVDTETGKITVLRYAAASYAGTVINPVLARLQDDGNVIYGLGPSLYEELIFDEGKIVNDTFAGYKIPAFGDLPAALTGQTLEGETDEIHGIGEMTLPPVSPAIANAIFDALGIRIYDLPLTAEVVLRHLKNG
jgi:CO/xanthine dehydrogenase Mo-binding subunit